MASHLSAESRQTLALLSEDVKFQELLADMESIDLFNESGRERWSPQNKITHDEVIYNDALHQGRHEVLSIFRGKF